jgi:hypothetical protein
VVGRIGKLQMGIVKSLRLIIANIPIYGMTIYILRFIYR